MISIDGSVFIQIINFIFLIWAMNMVLYKPIRKMLLQRKDKFSHLDQSIESCNSQVQEKESAFAAGIKDARSRGLKEKELLISSAFEEEKQVIEKINSRAQAELAEIKNRIASDAGSVRDALQKELGSLVTAISQKILGRAV
jgi:F-type H+-transporting ATPase subunit b